MRLKGNPTNVYAGSDTIAQDYRRQLIRDLTYIVGIISWVYISFVQVCGGWTSALSIGLYNVSTLVFLRQGVSLVWNLSNK